MGAFASASTDRRLDCRLVVPALAVWLGMWVVTGWTWGMWVIGGAAAACGIAWFVLRRFPLWRSWGRQSSSASPAADTPAYRHAALPIVGTLSIVLASCALAGGIRVVSVTTGVLARAAGEQRVASLEVAVDSSRFSPKWGMAVVNATAVKATIRGQSYALRQSVVVLAPHERSEEWLAYQAGSVVRLTARLAPPEAGESAAAVLVPLESSQLVRPPPAWQQVIETMRSGLVAAVSHSPPEQAGLLPALVVGDTSAMSLVLLDDFKATGLTHLTAVSGANLAILLSFLGSVALRLGVRGRGLTVVSVIGILVFIALCHSEPSVLRASAMGVVTLAGVGRGAGPSSGMRGLCLAVMGLCWIDPWMSRSWGFILSVLACLGILWWGRRWSLILSRFLPSWVADAMVIPLAAQVATQPVVCALSGAVSVSGLFANAAAGPWVAPATVVGLIAALVSPVSPMVSGWAGYVAGWCAQPILTIGHVFADLPGASRPWPTTPVGLGVIVAGCLALSWILPHVLSRVWLVLLVSVALVAAMLCAPYQPGWPGGNWRIVACDVGQGDALVVRIDSGQAMLIDVGSAQSGAVTCLQQLGIRQVALLVLTHLHADHAGALSEVLDAVPVSTVMVPEGGGSHARLQDAAGVHGVEVVTGRTGQRLQIGDVGVHVVSAYQSAGGSGDGEESAAENDQSLVVRVDTPQMSLLATGDVEPAGQQAASGDPGLLEVDVVKVPHHGSARQDQEFLAATRARIALVSVGADNGYGHPADVTIEMLVNEGMEVVRTDEHGSVAIAHSAGWSITTQR